MLKLFSFFSLLTRFLFKTTWPRQLFFCLLSISLCFFVGCGDSDKKSSGIERFEAGTQVQIISADTPQVLDPHDTSDGGSVKVINQIYQTLLRIDPQDPNRLLPELAKSWKTDEQGLGITFTIRENVSFHDGAKLDAAAVKLSLDRLRGQDFKLLSAPYAGQFSGIKNIQAQGMQLMVELTAPTSRVMLRNLSMFCASIISPQLLEKTRGKDPQAASIYVTKHAAGTGPYALHSFDPKAMRTRLQAFDRYWQGKPAMETLLFTSVPDENTRYEYLKKKSGYLFFDDLPRQHWKNIKENKNFQLHTWWALSTCYLGINAKHQKTSNPKLRKALQLAVDRSKILEHYEGTARSTYSLVPQPMAEYDSKIRPEGWLENKEQRLAQAQKLLEETNPEKLTLYYPKVARPYLPRPQDIADTLRNQFQAIGLEVDIQGEDNSTLFSSISTGKYELILLGWMTDNADPDNFYSPLADGDSVSQADPNNTSRLVNAEIHQKILEARGLEEANKRIQSYRAIEQMLQDRVRGYIPLVNAQQALAFSSSLKGVEVDALGHYRFHKAKPSQALK